MNNNIDKTKEVTVDAKDVNANLSYIKYKNRIVLPSPEIIKSMEERIKVITDLDLNIF